MEDTLTLDAMLRAKAAIDAMPKPVPMTIVQHHHMMRGKAWQMMDDGHLYAFVHPDDLAAIPIAPASLLGMAGVPIRQFDDEMRAVFVRGLDKLAAAQGAALSSTE